MADNKINVTGTENWKLQVTQAGTATLATAGKYVDRNISVVVPAAQMTITPAGGVDSSASVNPSVKSAIDSTVDNSITSITVSSNEGLDGKYYVIKPKTNVEKDGSAAVSVGGTASISKAGFVDAAESIDLHGDSVAITGIGVTIDDDSALYLPVKVLDESSLNGVVGFTGKDPSLDDGEVKDNLKVTLTLPAGYYEQQTVEKDFSDLLPSIDADAYDATILAGKRAYDEDGKVILGTMTNYGKSTATMTQTADGGATEIIGTSVTLRSAAAEEAAEKKSGISISSHGTVGVQSTIAGPGYYEGATSAISNFNSTTETQYITDIVVGQDNALNSVTLNSGAEIVTVTNNGTIDTLNGVGEISSLEGQHTIDSLKGSIIINNAVDEDSEKNGNGGKVKFGNDVIIQDGALVEASVKEEDGKIVVTKGWIAADAELDEITEGDYTVASTVVEPKVSLSSEHSSQVVVSEAETNYAISFTVDLDKAGSESATATISQAGYIKDGSKDTTVKTINVEGLGTKTVYLAEASHGIDFSTATYEDNTSVPKFYEVNVTSAGYTIEKNVAEIPVFNGDFAWS